MKKYPSIWRYYFLVFAAWTVYIALTLASPPSESSLGLSPEARVILRLTLIIPYMLTWLVAVVAWYHFRKFTEAAKRKKIPSYEAFRYISAGLGLLILDLILIPIFSEARDVWGGSEDMAILLTLLSNYSHIALPLLAFGSMYIGSRKLAQSSRHYSTLRSRVLPSLLATSLFISLFSMALFNNPSRQEAIPSSVFANYYISDPIIILTIITPLFVTWLLGLQTALNTEQYVHSLLQPRWQKAIIHFFHGLLAVLGSSIILQSVTAFGSQAAQQINLALLLAVLYLFIIVQAAGYLFIRTSAKQLHRLIKAGVPHETD